MGVVLTVPLEHTGSLRVVSVVVRGAVSQGTDHSVAVAQTPRSPPNGMLTSPRHTVVEQLGLPQSQTVLPILAVAGLGALPHLLRQRSVLVEVVS